MNRGEKMADRKIHGYCETHCKEPVYSQKQVDELIQQLEAGTLRTLLWYKGALNNYNYEYIGIDPKSISITKYGNLLNAIISGGVGLEEADMKVILATNAFHVKLWHEGAEYYATKDSKCLYIAKNNYFLNKIYASGLFESVKVEDGIKDLQLHDKVQDARLNSLEKCIITKETVFESEAGIEIGTIDADTTINVATLTQDLEIGTEVELHVTIPEAGTGNISYPLIIKMNKVSNSRILHEETVYVNLIRYMETFAGKGTTPIYSAEGDSTRYYYDIFPIMNIDKDYNLIFSKTLVSTIKLNDTTVREETNKSILLNKVVVNKGVAGLEGSITNNLLDQLNGEVV